MPVLIGLFFKNTQWYLLLDFSRSPVQINFNQPTAGSQTAGATAKPRRGHNEAIMIFSPEPGATVPFDDIYVAASLYNVADVDPASIKIYLDNRDVTDRAAISVDYVSYSPARLAAGQHKVRIELNNTAGEVIPGRKWEFQVVKKTAAQIEREYSHRGKFNGSYSRDPQGEGQYLDVFKTRASYSGQWRWLSFKTDLKLTTDEDPYKQPKNRYRLSFSLGRKFAMDFGDVSSRLSKYTVDGKRIRGINTDLKLGWLNFQLIKGELLRDIQGELSVDKAYSLDITKAIDSTGAHYTYELDRKGYTFRRDITAARLSFGSGKYVQVGFNMLKAKDDVTSVERHLTGARISVEDSTFYSQDGLWSAHMPGGIYTYDELVQMGAIDKPGVSMSVAAAPEKKWKGDSPQDNIVIGNDIKINIDNRHLQLEAGWAFSMKNTDIWDGAITKDDIDVLLDDSTDGFAMRTYDDEGNVVETGISLSDIPLDPGDIENIFVINSNMIPLLPIDIDSTALADDLLGVVARMPSLAYNAKLSANYFNNRFTVEYNRVGPKFNSLGNPYLQSDLREVIISDRVRLLRNKVFVGATYRHQDNNTLRVVPVVTTTKTITANIGVFPGPLYPSLNLKFSNKPRQNDKIAQDTLRTKVDDTGSVVGVYLDDNRTDENTMNITVGLNYQFAYGGLKHNLMLNYNKYSKEDLITDRFNRDDGYFAVGSQNDTTFYDTTFTSPDMNSYVTTLSLVTNYKIPLKTTLVLSFNNRTTVLEEQGINGINLNGDYALLEGKLKLNAGLGYTSGTGNNPFTRYKLRGGVNYRLLDNLSMRAGVDLRGVDSETTKNTVLILRADINYTF